MLAADAVEYTAPCTGPTSRNGVISPWSCAGFHAIVGYERLC